MVSLDKWGYGTRRWNGTCPKYSITNMVSTIRSTLWHSYCGGGRTSSGDYGSRGQGAFALPAAVQETFKEMLNKGLASWADDCEVKVFKQLAATEHGNCDHDYTIDQDAQLCDASTCPSVRRSSLLSACSADRFFNQARAERATPTAESGIPAS